LKQTTVQGFLLMEALLAILLTAGFSIVAGNYIHAIMQAYTQNKQYMHALEVAATIADKISYRQAYETPEQPFNVKIQKMEILTPGIIQGPMLPLAPIEVVTVSIAWKGMPAWQEIKLSTVVSAQA
jgi:hypothetical protein